jgi:hypothetical protein
LEEGQETHSRTLAPPAFAEFPPEFAPWREILIAQHPLEVAADALRDLIDRQPEAGFSAIELDLPNRTVTLYWKTGIAVPPLVSDLVTHLDSGPDVKINIVSALYSRLELRTETHRLFRTNATPSSVGVVLVEPLPRGAGLRVEVEGSTIDASKVLPERVFLRIESGRRKTAAQTRENDWPPYWGGGRVRFGEGEGSMTCSAGFAIANIWGPALLTAGHCAFWTNGVSAMDGAGDPMGMTDGIGASGLLKDLDTIRINTNSEGMFFDGTLGLQWGHPVKGASANYVGQYVCTSGSFSGVLCNIRVVAVGAYIMEDLGFGWTFGPMVHAEARCRRNRYFVVCSSVGGPGDSGGPVFSLDASSQAIAKGIMVAIDPSLPASCTGVIFFNGPRACSGGLFYTDIVDLLGAHGMWIQTK